MQNQAIIQQQPGPALLASNEIMTYEQKVEAEKHVKALITIYNEHYHSTYNIKPQIVEKYSCTEDCAEEISKLLDLYSEKVGDANTITTHGEQSLIKNYAFIRLIEKVSNEKLTKEVQSVDDIFNLFEFINKEPSFDFLKKVGENPMYQSNYYDYLRVAFCDTIEQLSNAPKETDRYKSSNAEKLYAVLCYFAERDGDAISEDIKNKLKGSKDFMEWLCSWLPEGIAEQIQDLYISQAIEFKPMDHKQAYEFKKSYKTLDKLISASNSKSLQ